MACFASSIISWCSQCAVVDLNTVDDNSALSFNCSIGCCDSVFALLRVLNPWMYYTLCNLLRSTVWWTTWPFAFIVPDDLTIITLVRPTFSPMRLFKASKSPFVHILTILDLDDRRMLVENADQDHSLFVWLGITIIHQWLSSRGSRECYCYGQPTAVYSILL